MRKKCGLIEFAAPLDPLIRTYLLPRLSHKTNTKVKGLFFDHPPVRHRGEKDCDEANCANDDLFRPPPGCCFHVPFSSPLLFSLSFGGPPGLQFRLIVCQRRTNGGDNFGKKDRTWLPFPHSRTTKANNVKKYLFWYTLNIRRISLFFATVNFFPL